MYWVAVAHVKHFLGLLAVSLRNLHQSQPNLQQVVNTHFNVMEKFIILNILGKF